MEDGPAPGSDEWWQNEILQDISTPQNTRLPQYSRLNLGQAIEDAKQAAGMGGVTTGEAIDKALSKQGFQRSGSGGAQPAGTLRRDPRTREQPAPAPKKAAPQQKQKSPMDIPSRSTSVDTGGVNIGKAFGDIKSAFKKGFSYTDSSFKTRDFKKKR